MSEIKDCEIDECFNVCFNTVVSFFGGIFMQVQPLHRSKDTVVQSLEVGTRWRLRMPGSSSKGVEDPEGASDGFEGFERILPENCVEYMLFIIDSNLEPRQILSSLESVRKTGMQLSNQLTKDHIWQRDAFSLELQNNDGIVCSFPNHR